jgi:glycine/D-amino acid oxidase-like deaminating enzyme
MMKSLFSTPCVYGDARRDMRRRGSSSLSSSHRCAAMRASSSAAMPTTKKVCVVGAGFAGASTAFHLLERANDAGMSVDVTLVDEVGIAGGASGVAAGLLHPYTPRGKTIWRGVEGVREAKRLIEAATRAEDALDAMATERCDDADGGWRDGVGRNTGERRMEAVARAPGIVRPARSAKQGLDFAKHGASEDNEDGARALTTAETLETCPGLEYTDDVLEAEAKGEPPCAGSLFIPEGVIVDTPRYLSALWDACTILASRGVAGTRASFRISSVDRVGDLFDEFDEVVLCCGAAVAALVDYEQIPIQLQGGHVLELKPEGLDIGILGTTYVAPLGGARAMVGPTKEYDATAEDARRAGVVDRTNARVAVAESQLRELGRKAFPPTANWDVLQVKYGVRGNPPRTPSGALPLVGRVRVDDESVWFAAGLGARGLVYHGLVGDWLARAILEDDVEAIPEEVRRE